jgi:hypothetical protein
MDLLVVLLKYAANISFVLWRIDPLISGDCKQRSLLDNTHNIGARNTRRTVFSVVRVAAVSG